MVHNNKHTLSSITDHELCELLQRLNYDIRKEARELNIKPEIITHRSIRGHTIAYRFVRGTRTVSVDIQLAYCSSVENQRFLKRSDASIRVRITTLSSSKKTGLRVDIPSNDLHLFQPSRTEYNDITTYKGYESLSNFVKTFF